MRMPIFLLKLFIFLAMLFVFVFVIVLPQYSTVFNASLIDKTHRLRSIDEPKIILVGGSSVAYGFDSARIQEAFNMPVVNFGINAAFGQAFHADMIRRYIGENDIVIIAPEHFTGDGASIPDPAQLWTALENHFFLWRNVPFNNYLELLRAFPTYLSRAVTLFLTNSGNQPVGHTFAREALNEFGDHALPRPYNIMWYEYDRFAFREYELSPEMRDYWNDYHTFVTSRGATLFMSSPPILRWPYMHCFAPLQRQLEYELAFPMISRLDDFVYPIEYFYDSGFHLNDYGVAVRTEQLIADLKYALSISG